MHTAGGRVSIVINGVVFSARGEVKYNPSSVMTDVGANQDGTLFKTVKPQPVACECTFDRFVDANGVSLKWNDQLMLLNNIPITLIEKDTGKMQMISNGTFVGDPQIDLGTGEVSGLKLAGEKHEEV